MIGALSYNQLKVDKKAGQILDTRKIIDTLNGNHSVAQLYRSFEPYLLANKRTEKPVLHISLNPDPDDKVSDESYRQIARDYMEQMGYGEQPYIVFKHTDISRTHIHIVSTCVDRHGKKISDTYEKRRSMDACRALEQKYNLLPATEKQRTGKEQIFRPVDYSAGDIKSQIASVVRYLPQHYQFTTLGAYNALLSLYNITAEEVKGELHGQRKNGLVYFALNEQREKIGHPFKASWQTCRAKRITEPFRKV
ncbi:MAG TPA: relaxase/mobilization nuclease domain-containing protein [Ginsengibacter sp.]|nr:relaxase/mobilization nuclease domain-containing protein [Ginsengibacter sp.]